ncbi:hypothetical protein [Roseovarius sp. EL26]|uniref:hypothetical protein n=1 Tax=Roseovarius sp. EL26 TaxID=2126672 RepID=UPI000EA230DC|nr:hypothetical protein [Roseovarius sp. EL26]
MVMIRPEARATLWQWREMLAGTILLGLGLWWALASFGFVKWLGYAFCIAGLIGLAAGIQRIRFRQGQDGPGVVQVVEGQISYFGPLDGGAIAIREMTRLQLDPTGHPAHWVLNQPGQPALQIPLTASGADLLFDAFASLPDLKTEQMLSTLNSKPDHPIVIWQKPTNRLH